MFGGLTKMKYLCTRLQEQGFVAQLNRASDYGSEGSGFESQRSHDYHQVAYMSSLVIFLFRVIYTNWNCSYGKLQSCWVKYKLYPLMSPSRKVFSIHVKVCG